MRKLGFLLTTVVIMMNCVPPEFKPESSATIEKIPLHKINVTNEAELLEPDKEIRSSIKKTDSFLETMDGLYGRYKVYTFKGDSGYVWNVEVQGYVVTGLSSVVKSQILQPYIFIIDTKGEIIETNNTVKVLKMDARHPLRISNTATFILNDSEPYFIILTALNERITEVRKNMAFMGLGTGITLEKYGPAAKGKYSIKLFK